MRRSAALYVVGTLVLLAVGTVAFAVSRSRQPGPDAPLVATASTSPEALPATTLGAETAAPPLEAGVLPNRALTPGAVAEKTTAVVCHRSTRTVRPPESYTERLKIEQIAEYGYTDTRLGDYEEDHLIPLELGGNPTDPKNLWPEPRGGAEPASDKDRVENALHAHVCAGKTTLAAAQSAIAIDWQTAES